mmetsp:Transcript_122260/g.341007  ORF Transcript_122260/g.341007 Transcript_122260/m.341007 type:complete len:183 (-) Transcript_122260:1740-2288(-)
MVAAGRGQQVGGPAVRRTQHESVFGHAALAQGLLQAGGCRWVRLCRRGVLRAGREPAGGEQQGRQGLAQGRQKSSHSIGATRGAPRRRTRVAVITSMLLSKLPWLAAIWSPVLVVRTLGVVTLPSSAPPGQSLSQAATSAFGAWWGPKAHWSATQAGSGGINARSMPSSGCLRTSSRARDTR